VSLSVHSYVLFRPTHLTKLSTQDRTEFSHKYHALSFSVVYYRPFAVNARSHRAAPVPRLPTTEDLMRKTAALFANSCDDIPPIEFENPDAEIDRLLTAIEPRRIVTTKYRQCRA
jgi:hypothetical protein